jgi:hypothetical protein
LRHILIKLEYLPWSDFSALLVGGLGRSGLAIAARAALACGLVQAHNANS